MFDDLSDYELSDYEISDYGDESSSKGKSESKNDDESKSDKSKGSNKSQKSFKSVSSFGMTYEELMDLIGLEYEDIDVGKYDVIQTDHGGIKIEGFSDIDISSIFKTSKRKNNFKGYKKFRFSKCEYGGRLYREYRTVPNIKGKKTLLGKDKIVYVTNGLDKNIVGITSQDFEIPINDCDPFYLADIYTEEVKGKGSGYGFSSLCHLCAIMQICHQNDCYVEPYEGADISFDTGEITGLTIEVTGFNYKNRKTSSKVIINKYSILQSCNSNDRIEKVMNLSNCEETNDSSFLINTEFFQGESNYTKHISRTHEVLRTISDSQITKIYEMTSSWLCHDYVKPEPLPVEEFDQLEFVGPKDGKYPSPFRVRAMKYDENLCNAKVVANLWKDNSGIDWYEDKHSTFRTCVVEDDYVKMSLTKSKIKIKNFDYVQCVEDKACNLIEEWQSVQSLRISYELYDKIQGYKGCYYSDKNGVGISWNTTHNSLVYNCVFFGSEKLEDKLFGIWVLEDGYYRSPGFKVSRQDISYTQKSYAALVSMYISMLNIYDVIDEIEEVVPLYANLINNSSWKTSDLADNCRFVTTGHMSGNDVKDLLLKPIKANKPIRSCEFLYIKLCERFLKSKRSKLRTPLFNLPLKYHCIEKDLGLALNWKNRIADHDTLCCVKLLDKSSEERQEKEIIEKFYEDQCVYLEKFINDGSNYSEFIEFMNGVPRTPILNVFFYIAMCRSCKDDIETAGKMQVSTKFSLSDLVSDRGSIVISEKCGRDSKVVEQLNKLLIKKKAEGPYDLLLKLFEEKHEKNYLIRSKNGRGRREFATQGISSRVIQSFEEKLASGISNAAPDDQFLNPHKYNEMVEGFISILSSNNDISGSSEDRSFHCGYNHPEAMSLACAIHAIVNQVPYFNTLAAIKRCNTYRWCILPDLYNEYLKPIPNNLEVENINFISRGKMNLRKKVKVYRHAMQGMHAVVSGVINTTHTKGVYNIFSKHSNSYDNFHIFTTQDDVGRAVQYKEDLEVTRLEDDFFTIPLSTLNMTLQVNNERKLVKINHQEAANGIIEVNNITVTGNGMITQSHIHPYINLQPLTSDSIIMDIESVVSNARQSIFWGDSPTVAMSCLNTGFYMLCSKWLLTRGEINYLREIGFIPKDSNELISGFFPRSKDALKIFTNCMDPDDIEDVMNNKKSLFDKAIVKFSKSLYKKKEVDEDDKELPKTELMTVNLKTEIVMKARLRKGRLRSALVKPLYHNMRLEIKTKFIDEFKKDMANEEDSMKLMCKKPPNVKGFLRPMNSIDKNPCKMGEVLGEKMYNTQNIICKRLLGFNYRTKLTDNELEKVKLNNEDFYEFLANDISDTNEEGFEVYSPSGLPVVRFLDNAKYTIPMAYSFSVELSRPSREARPFVYRGVEVKDFKPFLYGGVSMNKIRGNPAFGYGIMGEEEFVFYKKGPKGTLSHTKRRDSPGKITELFDDNMKFICCYVNSEDWSPFKTKYQRIVPGIDGDNTATVNYGGFLRSNVNEGFNILRKIHEDKGGFIPAFVENYMPMYPRFHDEVIEVKCDTLYLIGNKMISKLKYINKGSEVKSYDITNNPKEIDEDDFVD
jgi:hypothetical protein